MDKKRKVGRIEGDVMREAKERRRRTGRRGRREKRRRRGYEGVKVDWVGSVRF